MPRTETGGLASGPGCEQALHCSGLHSPICGPDLCVPNLEAGALTWLPRDRHISRWLPGSSGSMGLFQLKQLICKNSSNFQILLVKKEGFCPSRAHCVWPTASSLLDGFVFGDHPSHLTIFRLRRIRGTLRAVEPTCCSM